MLFVSLVCLVYLPFASTITSPPPVDMSSIRYLYMVDDLLSTCSTAEAKVKVSRLLKRRLVDKIKLREAGESEVAAFIESFSSYAALDGFFNTEKRESDSIFYDTASIAGALKKQLEDAIANRPSADIATEGSSFASSGERGLLMSAFRETQLKRGKNVLKTKSQMVYEKFIAHRHQRSLTLRVQHQAGSFKINLDVLSSMQAWLLALP